MASLRARHERSCKLGSTERAVPAKGSIEGCDCQPVFYVAIREGRKIHRERIGRNRRDADRALAKLTVQEDAGEYRPVPNIPFRDWAERWLASLEREETTRDSYRSTITYANEAFGSKVVRRLGPGDIAVFGAVLRAEKDGRNGKKRALSASTRAKHLRVLHACLQSAVSHGYAAQNPVARLPESERPRKERREAPYFANDELPRLFEAASEGVYRMLFQVALLTGMRQGELLALTWGDVDLQASEIHVRRSLNERRELSNTKTHHRRTVDLTEDAVRLLGQWWGALGGPGNDRLVFPAPGGAYLWPMSILRRELYPAMDEAKAGEDAAPIPRVGDFAGASPAARTFHSFRHTYARIALESGRSLVWVSRQLGHASVAVTDSVYGHWSRAASKEQAALLAGAFPGVAV
jgi:integrase